MILNKLAAKWIKGTLAIIACAFYSFAFAQEAASIRLSFHHLTPAEGLSEGSNAWIFRDSYGFAWISSVDGLNRFDGKNTKVYKPKPGDSTSISNAIITSSLFEDKEGNLWFTSYTGIHVYVRMLDQFRTYQLMDADGRPIFLDYFAFELTEDRKLWVRTGVREKGILHLFDIKKGTGRILGKIEGQRNLLLKEGENTPLHIVSTLRSRENGLLISTLGPDSTIVDTRTLFHENNGKELVTKTYNAIQSEVNEVWIGSDLGVIRLHPETGEYDLIGEQLGPVKSIAHHKDRLYISTTEKGLWLYNVTDGTFIGQIIPNEKDPYSIRYPAISSVTIDQYECLWLSYFEGGQASGVDFADLNKNRFPLVRDLQIGTSSPTAFLETENQRVIVANEDQIINYVNGRIESTWTLPGKLNLTKEDTTGTLWIVYRLPNRGNYVVAKFNTLTGQVTEVKETALGVFDLAFLPKGKIAAATTDGIYQLLEESSSIPMEPMKGMSVLDNTFALHIHPLTDKLLAVAANVNSLMFFSKNDDGYRSVLDIKNLGDCNASFVFPGDSVAWFSSSLGILEVQLESLKYRLLSEREDGLPAEKFYSILRDKEGYFWLKTKRDLIRYDLGKKKHIRYNAADGIIEVTGLNPPTMMRMNGEIWIGGKNGINIFHPDSIRPVKANARPQITGITINEAPLETERAHMMIDSLQLPYSQNSIAFDFVACDFSDPENVQYEYRLQGLDDRWIQAGEYGFARFFSLPHGFYNFEVRSANSDGIWSDNTANIHLRILPPWWATRLAKAGYILAFLASIQLIRLQIRRKQAKRLDEERQKLEQERRINDELRKVDKLKDQFLANTSHELRTPLNGIIGLADSLIDGATGKLPDSTVKNLSMISNAGKRLSNLVNDILDFSKLKTHDLSLNITDVDLHAATDIVITLLSPLSRSKDLTVLNKIPVNVPLIRADENRLQQILYNLIGNAIKFTDEGMIEIKSEELNGQIKISISDTGIGIAKDKFEDIFKSFEQGDGSSTRVAGGSGLGLSVTRQLVELHGGTIGLDSRLHIGSTFYFSIQKSTKSRAEFEAESREDNNRMERVLTDDPVEIIPGQAIHPDHGGKPSHILVVDDEPINRQVLQNHLSLAGYQVTLAANGKEALSQVKEHEFDLIILDIMMPGMSGFEVCRILRETHLPSNLPIIMLTAKNRIADLVEGFTVGANDYLAKPFSKDELLTRINTHLNLKNIHYTSGKFVPYAFLNAIGRERITDVELGDHAEVIVTVLFSDIRDYTSLAESMSPSDNFKFVNKYVGLMGPIIQANNGFVNQYLGDGIMAIFPGKPDEALKASIEMMEAIEEFNEKRVRDGQTPIRIGIGMHTGPLIMGIIGDEKRIDPATIADTVNTSSRLEGLTKHFKTRILLSEESIRHLSSPQNFDLRPLGKARVKGKHTAIGIFECYQGDKPAVADRKRQSERLFREALEFYLEKNFTKAVQFFEQILSLNPDDETAKLFLTNSLNYRDKGVPEGWNGIHDIREK